MPRFLDNLKNINRELDRTLAKTRRLPDLALAGQGGASANVERLMRDIRTAVETRDIGEFQLTGGGGAGTR